MTTYVTLRYGLKHAEKEKKEQRRRKVEKREEKRKKGLTFTLVFVSSTLEMVSGERKKTRLQRFALNTVKISLTWF